MKITFLSPVGVVGGAERVLLAAIHGARSNFPSAQIDTILFADGPIRVELGRLGSSVEVVPLPTQLTRFGDSRLRQGIQFRDIPQIGWDVLCSFPGTVQFLWRLRKALRRNSPDLIHSHGQKAHILSTLTSPSGVPILWHLHDFPTARPVMVRILRWLSHRIAGGIAISEAVSRDARVAFPQLKISVIRNAVDTNYFSPADRDGAGLDDLAGLTIAKSGVVRVGLIATYARWKGHDVFLDALGQLLKTKVLIRGYIVGGPIYSTTGSQFTYEELNQMAAKNNLTYRVGFIPFQPDPVDVFRMLDVVIHASTQPEPFGLTIAEAMSCGKPVVIAAAGGALELFTPGHDGLGHMPGNAEDLANVIARLALDRGLMTTLGANARLTAVARFSQDRYASEISAAYTSYIRSTD